MTTMNGSLPVVGAALDIASLPQYVDWLVDKQRDLEIQDPCMEGVLDGDFGAAREARALLNRHGYSGRLGVHAAYSGLDLSCSDPLILDVISKAWRLALNWARRIWCCTVHSSGSAARTPITCRAASANTSSISRTESSRR